ncbi:hypothetical protein GGS23DRAFT_583892 [Durotheca rogersii]|uniref:uncharacterized protein n=1 Tax=Durotheca rogersii TaxID=419775 RepID=UPI002220748B|nr:uncharacterized protein GGS23DRAFT_583892 [Durotheca rogersii]KAI5859841.1 hypothetical protein GGS23DRAFT_583892 [Durotheca rogersii]
MPKRKATQVEVEPDRTGLRRSTRQKPSAPDPTVVSETNALRPSQSRKQRALKAARAPDEDGFRNAPPVRNPRGDTENPTRSAATSRPEAGGTPTDSERSYWLMKAEPETRLENGVDVRFSIDDLRAREEPEPWDGKIASCLM